MMIRTPLLAGVAFAGLTLITGCASSDRAEVAQVDPSLASYFSPMGQASGDLDAGSYGGDPYAPAAAAQVQAGYEAVVDDGYAIPAIPTSKIDPQYLRQQVSYPEGAEYEPGTVVVDTPNRFLYVIQPGGTAMRYGIGVGRAGFSWKGTAFIRDKQHWPMWHPPDEMIDRKPELEPYRDGMKPGLTNPLGARALYLHQNGRDTLFRLHGTPEWWTIGTAASSGCIRLINQDIIDLYERVPMDAKVVVKQGTERLAQR